MSSKEKNIIIIIEKSENSYSAFADNVEGVYGQGNSVDEAKQSALAGLNLFIQYNQTNLPSILKGNYNIIYKYDTESFLSYYKKIFTNAALERMTGINQKQLQHYASGLKKPRPNQAKKIELAMHSLGKELLAVQL